MKSKEARKITAMINCYTKSNQLCIVHQILYLKMATTVFDSIVIIFMILINLIVLGTSAYTLHHHRRDQTTIIIPIPADDIGSTTAAEDTEPDITIVSYDDLINDRLTVHFYFNRFYRLSLTEFRWVLLVMNGQEEGVFNPFDVDLGITPIVEYKDCLVKVEALFKYPHPIIHIRDHGHFRLYGWTIFQECFLHILQPLDNDDIYFFQTYLHPLIIPTN